MISDRELIEQAFEARGYAYVPYSHYAVGAAILTRSGKVFTGCNIESASYSPTNCAERTAAFKAVSEGEREFDAIAVVGGREEHRDAVPAYAAPCGVCRQVLAEFSEPGLRILLAKSPEDYRSVTLGELLPMSFTKADL